MPLCFDPRLAVAAPPPPPPPPPPRDLSDREVRDLSLACCLLGDADAPLTPLERALIVDVGRMFFAHGRGAPIHPASWRVIAHAASAFLARETRPGDPTPMRGAA